MTPLMVLVLGPTASGKTSLGIALAQKLDCRVLSIDSRQLYSGMDIGTAKPSADDRATVPHHCIDLLDADQDVTVSWFQEVARAAIADVHAQKEHALHLHSEQ